MSIRTEMVRSSGLSSGVSLPDDILGESRRRLRWACLVYAGGFTLGYGAPRLIFNDPRWASVRAFTDVVALVSVGLAVVLALWLTPGRKLRSGAFIALGLTFEVVSALGIALSEYSSFFMPAHVSEGLPHAQGLSWVAVWIVVFPALVPARWNQTLPATLLAAATSPLVLAGSYWYFDPVLGPEQPLGGLFIGMVIGNGTCAIMALVVSSLIHGLTRKVSEARKLGAYHLVELIGRGGMGEVWRAEHRLLVRPAAVKLVRPAALESDTETARRLLRRFEREAQATAQLRCPHTIGLYDFGIAADGTFYYVMELLEGLTLEHLVEKFGPQPAERVVYLLKQVCDSLEEAHERGLVHRDIKPANVFCCRYGLDFDFAKVLDFGLVKRHSQGAAPSGTRLTADGSAAGTPAYMSPETIIGDLRVDSRTDLYALGCVAFWLLTGHLVFEGATPMRMAMMHIEQEPLPPSALSELEIPPELDAIILDCLAKRSEDRPQTAGVLRQRLERVPLSTPWTRERAAAWWSKHLPEESTTGSFVGSSSDPTPRALEETAPGDGAFE